ncbi:MAG: sugar ABC transporter permease [Chloroflexi bacterium]|nr:sugar ABC transporter permease [Chloroflexota bacterium]
MPLLYRWKSWIQAYQTQLRLFLLPYLAGMVLLVALPGAITAVIAFTDYNTIQPPTWVGLENFQRLREYSLVRHSLRNTLLFVLTAVPLRLFGALFLALLLQRKRRPFGLYRTAVYLPTVIPEAAYALIWLWIFNPIHGPLNLTLGWLGLPAPAWLTEPNSARAAIVIMSLFQIGEGFVVLLAGLQTIPRTIYEAARVDGANAWQSFWRITLPLITPWLLLLTFRDLLMSVQNTFTPSFMMTYGGPYYATTFVPLLIYEIAFDLFDYGLASALLLVLFAFTGAAIMGILSIVGSWKER